VDLLPRFCICALNNNNRKACRSVVLSEGLLREYREGSIIASYVKESKVGKLQVQSISYGGTVSY
jgi:hypothetical protein